MFSFLVQNFLGTSTPWIFLTTWFNDCPRQEFFKHYVGVIRWKLKQPPDFPTSTLVANTCINLQFFRRTIKNDKTFAKHIYAKTCRPEPIKMATTVTGSGASDTKNFLRGRSFIKYGWLEHESDFAFCSWARRDVAGSREGKPLFCSCTVDRSVVSIRICKWDGYHYVNVWYWR